MYTTSLRTAVLGVIVAASLTGCSVDDSGATRTADDFAAAIGAADGAAACALLAPATVEELEASSGQPCAVSVLDEARDPGDREDVTTFGAMSQVRFTSDTLFVTEFDTGWLVVAASCTPKPGGPYDCGIQGR